VILDPRQAVDPVAGFNVSYLKVLAKSNDAALTEDFPLLPQEFIAAFTSTAGLNH
jgi:hypothetical protein